MADNKKGFILYADQIDIFEELSDEDAGKLAKHIFRYVNDQNPEAENPLVKLAFVPIKQQLKRDLKKYEAKCSKNKDNINKRWNKTDTNVYERIPVSTKHTDTDNDTDNDKDSSSIITSARQLKTILDTLDKEKINQMIEFTLFKGNLEELKQKFCVEFIGRYGLNKTSNQAIEAFQSWMHKDKGYVKEVKTQTNSLELAAKKTKQKFHDEK